MGDDIAVIWYDSNTKDTESESATKILLDAGLNACLTVYSNLKSCITHVVSLPKQDVYFITSETCAQEILPIIHPMRQIDSVFLFSPANKNTENLIENYSKIIACVSDEKTLTESIRENIELSQRQKLVFSFYNQHKKPTRQLSKESALFLWFQILKNALLNLPSDDKTAKDDLVNFLRQRYRNNSKQLKLIDQFAEKYRAEEAISWYTGQPFLYRHVNKALRTEDIDQLFIFRRFIGDLCRALLQEYEILKEYEPVVNLYRGTRMLNNEYDKLKVNVGNLISMNGFLSTSLLKEIAVTFAGTSDERYRAVVFEINCDLSKVKTVILAPIVGFSVIKHEQEVLVDIGAVFRLLSVNEQDTITWIKLEATDEGTKAATSYLEINQAELKEKNARIIWGDLLSKLGYHDKALEYFHKLRCLDKEIPEWQLQIHIGHALSDKGSYEEGAQHYLTAAELWDEQSSEVNISILSHLSAVQIQAGNFEKPREILVNALEIYQNETKIEHDRIYYHDIASMLSNLGNCCLNLGDYDQAIKYYNEAWKTRETYYASDHFESAGDLGCLGVAYRMKGNPKRALHYFGHATAIYERNLPPDHPKIVPHLINIAQAYADQNRKEESIEYAQKALSLQQNIAADSAVDKALTRDICSLIAFVAGDDEQTIAYTQSSLEIKRTYLYEDHPSIAHDLTTLGNILKELGRNDEAIVHFTEALKIYERLKPDGRPETAIVLHGLGFIYCANKDYDTAFSHYSRAQTIYEKYFTPNDSNHIRLVLSIAELHQLKSEFCLAIDTLQRCLAILQDFNPVDKALLRRTYMMLADTYMLVDNVIAALYQYEKGLSIEVDDEIEHYVYLVGYHLLMLSCKLKSQEKHQQAQTMNKNASIIFRQLDKFALFDLVAKLATISRNDSLNDALRLFKERFGENALKYANESLEILRKITDLSCKDIDALSYEDQCLYYYYSMALYQQLFIDTKQRTIAMILLGIHHEKQDQKDLMKHYYDLAKSLYKELVDDAASETELSHLKDILNL